MIYCSEIDDQGNEDGEVNRGQEFKKKTRR